MTITTSPASAATTADFLTIILTTKTLKISNRERAELTDFLKNLHEALLSASQK